MNQDRTPRKRCLPVPTINAHAATIKSSQVNELFEKLPVSKLKTPEGPSEPFFQTSNPISELAGRPVRRSTISGKCNSDATHIDKQNDFNNLLIPLVVPDRRLPTNRPANIVTAGIKKTGSNAIPKARSNPVSNPSVSCVRSFIPGPGCPPIEPYGETPWETAIRLASQGSKAYMAKGVSLPSFKAS